MKDVCSLHCGQFKGVDNAAFEREKAALSDIFSVLRHDPSDGTLDLCGAQGVKHDPSLLIDLFNRLAGLLDPSGQGSIILSCESKEICYFRRNMWKLLPIPVPEDPFAGVYYVKA